MNAYAHEVRPSAKCMDMTAIKSIFGGYVCQKIYRHGFVE